MVPLSVLDLSPIVQGGDATAALRNTVDLARHAEGWGYRRYWLAEHHNMAGIASAATSIVIGHVAGSTNTIRVGAGGIMLPNHSPLIIAEQFGTLATLYPGRIALGVGRAPGISSRATGIDCRSWSALAGTTCARHSRRRIRGAGLDSRFKPLWGSARSCSRPSLRFRIPFRAGRS